MTTHTASRFPDPAQLASQLRTSLPQFQHIEWLGETGSTNSDLIEKARQKGPGNLLRPWLLGTHHQQRGRGRGGRTWQNRAGATLMFSCAYDVFLSSRHLPALSPLAGLAATEALRRLLTPANRHSLVMKWPNDVLWQRAKLAGILIDASRASTAATPDHHVIVIGIGLNLNDARSLSQSLNRQVADWDEISHIDTQAAHVSVSSLVAALASAWYDILNETTKSGFDWLPERYAQVDALKNQPVDIIDRQHITHSGIAGGVNTEGQLLLRDGDTQIPIVAGDVSLRPHPTPH